MIFESKYRRQALQSWEQSRQEAKQEISRSMRQNHFRLVHGFQRFMRRMIAYLRSRKSHT